MDNNMYNIIPSSVLVPVIFVSYFNIIKPHVTSCSDKQYDSGDEECTEERHDYTPFYMWIGIVSGITLCLMLVFVSCLCCRCCLIYKRRRALQEATARRAEISTITRAEPSSGDHVPQYPTQPMPRQTQITTNEALQVLPHESQYTYFQQQYPANHVNAYQGASSHPMYAPSAPPVYPDEPPPQYKP